MRDLLLLAFPVIVLIYILVFPDQFQAAVAWLRGF
jgi:hypothetical protein